MFARRTSRQVLRVASTSAVASLKPCGVAGSLVPGTSGKTRHPREALARYDAALAINPTSGGIVAGEATALAALGEADAAERTFAEAGRLAPDRSETFSAWADARQARGDVAGAQQMRAEAARVAARNRGA